MHELIYLIGLIVVVVMFLLGALVAAPNGIRKQKLKRLLRSGPQSAR